MNVFYAAVVSMIVAVTSYFVKGLMNKSNIPQNIDLDPHNNLLSGELDTVEVIRIATELVFTTKKDLVEASLAIAFQHNMYSILVLAIFIVGPSIYYGGWLFYYRSFTKVNNNYIHVKII